MSSVTASKPCADSISTVRASGTPDQVLAKLRAYQAEGIEAFILSGYPHAQEADLFARHVLPHIAHAPLTF